MMTIFFITLRKFIMKAKFFLFSTLFLIQGYFSQSQVLSYSYNFGSAASTSSTTSEVTNFFPSTPTNGGTYRIQSGAAGTNFGLLTSSGLNTSQTATTVPYYNNIGSSARFYMRAAQANNATTKFAVTEFNGATSSMALAFDLFIDTYGTPDGRFVIIIGNNSVSSISGSTLSSINTLAGNRFTAISISIGASGTTASYNDNGNSNQTFTIPNLKEGYNRVVIVANNNNAGTGSTAGASTYSLSGNSYTVETQKFDMFINGDNVVNDGTAHNSFNQGVALNSFSFNAGFAANPNFTLVFDNLSYAPNANSAAALPVTLSSFTAKQTTDNKVSLAWVTSSESVNKGFSIERQEEGSGKFQSLGFITSKAEGGNSQSTLAYSFKDVTAKNGANLYRLVQEDLDGKKTYSEVRVVKLSAQSVSNVFPNPSNGAINISRTNDGKKMNIQVLDQSGRVINQVNNITDANYRMNLPQSGIYSIKMMYPETGERSTQRIVVHK
jgi:hypothetical protein